jgi:signal recognition particle receptor subunit beta
MVFFNYATMQMAAKIVYYGPGLCGKTTNLHHIYTKTSPQSRGEMVSLETETDRTLFFDLLPIDVGVIGGFKTRLQLYTVPGQVFYNTTRKLVLKGVDGIVFVADSQQPALEGNVESLKNLRENLAEIGLNMDEIPLVIQLNKRDLPNILPVETMLDAMDPDRRFEHTESVASNGTGVFETLKVISKLTLRTLRRRMTGEEPVRPSSPTRPVAQFRVQSNENVPTRTVASTVPLPQTATHAVGTIAPEVAQPATVSAAALAPEIEEEVEALEVSEQIYPDDTLAATANVGAGSMATAPVAEPPAEVATADVATAAPAVEPAPAAEAATATESVAKAPEPEIDFSQTAKPQKVAPLKTVKVRSSVDVMAELEALRKRATTQTSTPKPAKKDVAMPEITIPKPRRDITRTVNLSVPQELLPKARSLRVTLSFEDSEQGVLETRDQQVDLGDTSDVQSLSVNLKVDLA